MPTLPSSTFLRHSRMPNKNIVVPDKANTSIDFDYVSALLPHFSHRNVSFNSVKLTASGVWQLFPNGKSLVIGSRTENETKQTFDMYIQELLEIVWVDPKIASQAQDLSLNFGFKATFKRLWMWKLDLIVSRLDMQFQNFKHKSGKLKGKCRKVALSQTFFIQRLPHFFEVAIHIYCKVVKLVAQS